MYIKNLVNLFVIILMSIIIVNPAYCYATIKAENNAYRHNNKGLIYLSENYYYGAIKEFQIAIDLMPNAQGSAVYYVNLGTTYEKIGYPDLALPCYEKALSLHPLYFGYYKKLAEHYKKMGLVKQKLKEYKLNDFSPLNDIMVGLLYIQNGDIKTGIAILDEFCDKEPELLVTPGVKEYISNVLNHKTT